MYRQTGSDKVGQREEYKTKRDRKSAAVLAEDLAR